jgi:hypothetical protein
MGITSMVLLLVVAVVVVVIVVVGVAGPNKGLRACVGGKKTEGIKT